MFPTVTPSPTPTSTPTQIPSPTPIVLPQNYQIMPGDTLEAISIHFAVPMIYIALANHLENTNLIIAGQVLLIPDSNNLPAGLLPTGKKILVVLSEQKVYAFEDGRLLQEFLVSTGLPQTPTVVGKFQIYIKLETTRMTGENYDLPNVPWTMYFYQDYGLHGTYWHNNFGHPMSHGCVNLRTVDAKWLYDWAPIGTLVEVIP
jgi:lipoprotein-anchoring transpeptidase ErfK/SrfK